MAFLCQIWGKNGIFGVKCEEKMAVFGGIWGKNGILGVKC